MVKVHLCISQERIPHFELCWMLNCWLCFSCQKTVSQTLAWRKTTPTPVCTGSRSRGARTTRTSTRPLPRSTWATSPAGWRRRTSRRHSRTSTLPSRWASSSNTGTACHLVRTYRVTSSAEVSAHTRTVHGASDVGMCAVVHPRHWPGTPIYCLLLPSAWISFYRQWLWINFITRTSLHSDCIFFEKETRFDCKEIWKQLAVEHHPVLKHSASSGCIRQHLVQEIHSSTIRLLAVASLNIAKHFLQN